MLARAGRARGMCLLPVSLSRVSEPVHASSCIRSPERLIAAVHKPHKISDSGHNSVGDQLQRGETDERGVERRAQIGVLSSIPKGHAKIQVDFC